jgi:hypothetical protein
MVKSSSGKTDMRSFTVVDVRKANGASTKFHKDSRYINKSPAQAARKAGHELCNKKRIKGRCVFLIRVQETTQGSSGKTFDYTFKRLLLDEPIVVGDRKYFYTSKVYSEKNSAKFGKSSSGVASKGRMMKTSRRSNTLNNDAPKYKKSKTTSSSSKINKKKSNKTKKTKKNFMAKLFS